MAGGIYSRTAHFALHRLELTASSAALQQHVVLAEAEGRSCKQQLCPLFILPGHHIPQIWLGPLVPKRWARRSVTRHAIRRQIYAVGLDFLPQLQELPMAAYVVRLRAGFNRQYFVSAVSDELKRTVRAELQQLFAYAVRRHAQSATIRTVVVSTASCDGALAS